MTSTTRKDWILSLHLLPLETGILVGIFLMWLVPISYIWPFIFFLAGSLCTLILLIILPLAPLQTNGPHHVGIRHISRNLAVYYPTFVKPIEGEPWLPGNDLRFIQNMAAEAGVRVLWLKHLKFIRIPCTRNANIVSLLTHEGKPREIFIMSHTLPIHHLAYSRLALALSARGAIVFSILHSDDVNNNNNNLSILKIDDSESERSQLLDHRSIQLSKRVEEVVKIIEGISSGELVQKLQLNPLELESFLSYSPKINLIGHGFGALTMLAVALKDLKVSSLIGSIIAMDPWPLNLLNVFLQHISLSLPSHINIHLLSSEEWYERREQSVQMEELKELLISSGIYCDYKTYSGTDHTSITDMGLLTPLTRRKKFASKKSSIFIPQVAKEIIRFTEGRERSPIGTFV